MTVLEKINEIKNGKNYIADEWERQLWLAYWIGREEATVEVSDRYRDWIARMREKADESRYKKMINRIIDNDEANQSDGRDYLYMPGYSKDVTHELADDEYIEPKGEIK